MTIDAIAREFSARGLRLTRQRRAVVDVLLTSPRTMSPLQVFEAARAERPDLGLTTVYRTLEVLEEIGCLRRVHGSDNCEGFAAAESAHGHSLVCAVCGEVREFTECDIEPVVAAVSAETGFVITDHFLQLSGLCGRCAAGAGRRPAVRQHSGGRS